jgi:Tfp pilus assembly protein PilO
MKECSYKETNINDLKKCLQRKSIKIENKINEIKKHKMTRYFTKHKGKTIIILLLIGIIIGCIIYDIPISGELPEQKEIKTESDNISRNIQKSLAFFGFISTNIILALLISITGVETLISREENNEIRKEQKEYGKNFKKLIKQIKTVQPIVFTKHKINKLKTIVNNMKNKSKSSEKYDISKIYISNISASGSDNSIINFNDINLEVNTEELNNYISMIEYGINYDSSLDEEYISEIIVELDNIFNEKIY